MFKVFNHFEIVAINRSMNITADAGYMNEDGSCCLFFANNGENIVELPDGFVFPNIKMAGEAMVDDAIKNGENWFTRNGWVKPTIEMAIDSLECGVAPLTRIA